MCQYRLSKQMTPLSRFQQKKVFHIIFVVCSNVSVFFPGRSNFIRKLDDRVFFGYFCHFDIFFHFKLKNITNAGLLYKVSGGWHGSQLGGWRERCRGQTAAAPVPLAECGEGRHGSLGRACTERPFRSPTH